LKNFFWSEHSSNMFTQTATLRTCSRSMLHDVSHRLIVTCGKSYVTQ